MFLWIRNIHCFSNLDSMEKETARFEEFSGNFNLIQVPLKPRLHMILC